MRLHLIWLCVVGFSGCATVSSRDYTESTTPLLPKARLSSDSVVLEVGFVDIPTNDAEWSDRVWAEVDEQHLPPEFRRAMQANGFRCGLVGIQMPTELRQEIDRYGTGAKSVLAELAGQSTKFRPKNRRIQLRSGKRSEVVTSGTKRSLVVLVADGKEIVGKTFHDAQTVFELKAFPLGDGSTRVHLTPEVQYGPQTQKWIGRDGMFQLEAGRKRNVFHNLAIDSTLLPGHTLLITSLKPSRSLGGNFFLNGESSATQKMLMIRLAQSQYDDLFDVDEEEVQPVSDPPSTPTTHVPDQRRAPTEATAEPTEAAVKPTEAKDSSHGGGLTTQLD